MYIFSSKKEKKGVVCRGQIEVWVFGTGMASDQAGVFQGMSERILYSWGEAVH